MSALLRAFLLALAAASGAAFISSSPPPLFASHAASAASTRTAISMGGFGKAAAAQKDKAPKFLGKKSILKQVRAAPCRMYITFPATATVNYHHHHHHRHALPQMKSYIALQKAQEEGMVTRDVYVKAVLRDETVNEKFWFVGKVAHRAGFSTDQALGMQKRVVLEHAKLLQGVRLVDRPSPCFHRARPGQFPPLPQPLPLPSLPRTNQSPIPPHPRSSSWRSRFTCGTHRATPSCRLRSTSKL